MHEEAAALREALATLEAAEARAVELLAAELPEAPAELAAAGEYAVGALCDLALAVNACPPTAQANAQTARRLLPRLADRTREARDRMEEAP